jgi:hypothetical protein
MDWFEMISKKLHPQDMYVEHDATNKTSQLPKIANSFISKPLSSLCPTEDLWQLRLSTLLLQKWPNISSVLQTAASELSATVELPRHRALYYITPNVIAHVIIKTKSFTKLYSHVEL